MNLTHTFIAFDMGYSYYIPELAYRSRQFCDLSDSELEMMSSTEASGKFTGITFMRGAQSNDEITSEEYRFILKARKAFPSVKTVTFSNVYGKVDRFNISEVEGKFHLDEHSMKKLEEGNTNSTDVKKEVSFWNTPLTLKTALIVALILQFLKTLDSWI